MSTAQATDRRIIRGDCRDILPTLSDVDLLFADPPYNIGIDYGNGSTADRLPPAEFAALCDEWVRLSADALSPTGSMWVLVPHDVAWHVGPSMRDAGLHYRATVVWHESFGVHRCRNFGKTSRQLLYFVKDPDRFVFDDESVRVVSERQRLGDKRADPRGKIMDDVWSDIPRLCGTHNERLPGFPTQLPLALLRRIVAVSSRPGDLVVDPFSGSATTGVAAVSIGRRYIGIERSGDFVGESRRRLDRVQLRMF